MAVVTPVYGHSVLITEAIESVLSQQAQFPIRLVLVNDGCPLKETDEICMEYAMAYPEFITYLKKANGGLSSARNHGIEYALAAWPKLDAIYMLDADNRIRPQSLQRAMNVLDSDARYDWVYPNIDMFGVRWAGDYGGEYSLLNQAMMNACEAGSMVRRKVFEAGVRFDTNMRLGFEDWDFFVSASEKGMRGANLDDLGFQYRKRPESMLADSTRDEQEIMGYMRRKHRAFFNPRNLVGLESEEAPRFAIYLADTGRYLLTVDPDLGGKELAPAEFEQILWSSWTSPSRSHAPSHLVVSTTTAIQALREAKLLHWTLWKLEVAAETHSIGALTHEPSSGDTYRIAQTEDTRNGEHLRAIMVMVGPKCLREILQDPHSTWIDTVIQAKCEPRVLTVNACFPKTKELAIQAGNAGTVHTLLARIHGLRSSRFRPAAALKWGWRDEGIPVRNRPFDAARAQIGGGATIPRIRKTTDKHIGFLLPLVDFGGVEKVALNVARALRDRGWTPHLVVLERDTSNFSSDFRDVFASIIFLGDEEQRAWDGRSAYMGTDIPPWTRTGNHSKALGLLYWLDVVVNCHGAAANGLMGQLRRLGIKTIASLHLSDETKWGRPVGHSYLTLAFEHAYDLVTTCSLQLADWCHAMGFPREKVVAVPNAPSFRLSSTQVEAALARRAARKTSDHLRVLFLGRIDRQKGVHRLNAVIEGTVSRRMPAEWRVIGRPVLGATGVPKSVQRVLEPPTNDLELLSEIYDWADVLVLLSDYEGLPLTILEAMRVGVTCVATNVGAVSEVIVEGETGFLLDPQAAVSSCLDVLNALARDRSICQRIGRAAADSVRSRSWESAVAPVSERLAALQDARN